MTGSSSKVSISTVAAKAKVSTATVSRVLSGARTKEDDIARRVRKAAASLHYSADFAASALRGSTSGTIGLIVPDQEDSFAAQFALEFETAISSSGREIYLGFSSGEGRKLSDRVEALVARRCDGVVIVPRQEATLPDCLKEVASRIPIIQIGGGAPPMHVNWIGVDLNASMRAIFDLLQRRGATHLGYFGPSPNGSQQSDAFASFSQTAEQTGVTYDPEWVVFDTLTVGQSHDVMTAKLLEKTPLPDAIVCASDISARGVLLACAQNDVHIPNDLLVVGFGDSMAATLTYPNLTSIHPPYELMADEALRLIENGIAKGMRGWLPAHLALTPKIVERASTLRTSFGSSDMAEPDDLS
jgi:LacI family transcriptional regulator